MRRRALLSALATAGATALAGCNALLGGSRESTSDGTPTAEPTDEPTPSPPETPEDDLDVAEAPYDRDPLEVERLSPADLYRYEAAGRVLSLAPSTYRSADRADVRLRFVDESGDAEGGPPRVEATLTNASRFENVFRLREHPLFDRVNGARPGGYADIDVEDTSYRSNLYLVPTANHDLVEDAEPYVERDDDGIWRFVAEPTPRLPELLRLAPEETAYGEYYLLGHPDGAGGGIAPGEYDFRYRRSGFRITAWNADEPGPTDPSAFAGESPPDLPRGEPTRWYHDADGWTTAYLHPNRESARLPAEIEFALVNHGEEPLEGNPYDWALFKLVDGEWFKIAPWAIPMPAGALGPGAHRTWTLEAFARHSSNGGTPYLGGGTYAFRAGMSADAGVHAAMVELDAPPVEATPEDDATAERDGDLVTVRSPRWDAAEPDRRRALAVSRTESPAAERFIPEQVMRRPYEALRNVLPYFEGGVERVRLETDRHAIGIVPRGESELQFEYEGHTYLARTEEP